MIKKIKRNRFVENFLISAFAIVISLAIAAIFMLAAGYNPMLAYAAMFDGAFGSLAGAANTISKATPLILAGLAFSFAAKQGIFNIGGEAQLYMGALFSTVTALVLNGLPRAVVLPCCILAGFIGGALVGTIIGMAKAKLNISEVIVAIMLNYIVGLLIAYLVNGPLKAEGSMTSQTEAINPLYMFGLLMPRTQLSTALFVAGAVAGLVYLYYTKTRMGFNLRVLGMNRQAGEAAGIAVSRNMIIGMAIAGGLCGLCGMTEVFGKYGRLIEGFSPGFGFTGIAVSVLAANHPIGLIFPALLFGAMDAGAMKMAYTAGISANMIGVIQGLVILFVATPFIARAIFAKRRKDKNHG